MKHRTCLAMLAAILCAVLVAPAGHAQDRGDDRYDDDERNERRVALGLGAGVVEPDGSGEIYYHGAVRVRLFDDEGDDRDEDDWRYGGGRGDIQAHIEPEVGYWQRDENGASESDLSLGLNAVGLIPGRVVDYYFGVGLGFHFLDTQIDGIGTQPDIDESDEAFGGNFHVGLDVHLSEHVSLFGTGRLDVVEGQDETLQSKVFMGLRIGL